MAVEKRILASLDDDILINETGETSEVMKKQLDEKCKVINHTVFSIFCKCINNFNYFG
jgi:hypothetical protein